MRLTAVGRFGPVVSSAVSGESGSGLSIDPATAVHIVAGILGIIGSDPLDEESAVPQLRGDSMATMKAANLWCLTAIAIAAVASGVGLRFTLTPPPVSMIDAMVIAQANGLWTFACDNELDGESATCRKIIASRRQLTAGDRALLMTADPDSSLWRGCVCVIQVRAGQGIHHVSPAPEVIIRGGDGDLLLCGDRDLAKSLKAWIVSNRSNR